MKFVTLCRRGMILKLFAAVYGSITALLISVIYDKLLVEIIGWPVSAAFMAIIFLGVVLLLAYEFVTRSKLISKRFYPMWKIQGCYAISILGESSRPRSLCRIKFSKRGYVYSGYGINPDGTIGSEWVSRDVHFDDHLDELSFTADSTLTGDSSRLRNYGYIKFEFNTGNRVENGNGYFVDMAKSMEQTHMYLERISVDEYQAQVSALFHNTANYNVSP